MATIVIMPKVDMDQETGKVIEWIKKDGDQVEKGEIILVIETEKVAIDVESPATGILRGILAKPEEIIPIGRTIAYILEPGEELPEGIPHLEPSSSPKPTTVAASEVDATPVARNIATPHNIDLSKVSGTGLRGKITKDDVEDLLTTIPDGFVGNGKVYATPAARRTARELDVDIISIKGSGPGNRIQASDVLAETLPLKPSSEDVIPLQGMRATIADRMTASYKTTPHISFTIRVDMSRIKEIRAKLNIKAEKNDSSFVSMTSLLVKAVAWALKRHPYLNSTLKGDGIHLIHDINMGVAVAIEQGLIVPVVQNADRKGIGEITSVLNGMVDRARKGELEPADVSGGSFTISNLGPFGIEQFTAIINPPQAAILAVGATQPEVVLDEEGQITAKPIMRMTLSADHRIVDGSVAAHFLNDLREVLESPELLLL